MDNLSFLDEPTEEPQTEDVETPEEPEAPEQPETPQENAEPEEKADRPRGPDGKFIAAEEPKPEPIMVPLAALQEVRDEVRALKAERETRQPQQPAPQVPDMFEDPEGFKAYQDQQVQQAIYAERLNNSYRFAALQHGQELVQQATEWARDLCARDPNFNMAAMSQLDPVGFAIEQFQRDQIATKVDYGEFQKFQAWQAAQAQAQQQQPDQGQQQPSAPPQSIASLPSSGGADHVPVGPGQAFDSLFTR